MAFEISLIHATRADPKLWLEEMLDALAQMAGGDLERRVPLLGDGSDPDALAYGVNTLTRRAGFCKRRSRKGKRSCVPGQRSQEPFPCQYEP